MKKYSKGIFVLFSSILFCTACGNDKDIATSTAGNITEKELNSELKTKFGQPTLYQMMIKKVLLQDAKIEDKDIQTKLEQVKQQAGDQFQNALKMAGLKDEEALKEQLKVQLALEQRIKQSITEKDVKERYQPELHIYHILVKDENKARELAQKIQNGADFSQVAKQESEDTVTKEKGGDLGFIDPGKLGDKFKNAAYRLQIGQISEPVQTQFGYHLIKVTEKKDLPPFNEVKDTLRKQIEKERISDAKWQQKEIEKALKDAKVEVKDSDLKHAFTQQNQLLNPTP
ncbi:peptidylprolyl isomerase [Bacillus thuringiensis]|uniref:peptidylprolyl isomerase n=1 Tax=Bacillus thuringiensis TaxID=1428 RepID=UPI003BF69B07